MPWNHRIMRKVCVDKTGHTEVFYGIVEAYYDEKGAKLPHSWTEEFVEPSGQTIEELVKDFARMMAALRLPVLDHNGSECDPAYMLADDIQKWIDETKNMPAELN